jgi:ATP-dependent Clp protease ATP-binding subunit ClpA
MDRGNEVVQAIVDQCTNAESGARDADAVIERTLLPGIVREVLTGPAQRSGPTMDDQPVVEETLPT